jgi:F-type H+-transporting ATPase subunit b
MRQRVVLFLALLCRSLLGGTAAAKDEHPPAAGGGHASAPAKDEINIFEPRFDLAVWSIVVFLGLMFILKKYAWGPMVEGLQKREERIKGALEEARKTREQAKQLQIDLQRKMDGAAQEIATMMEAARRDAGQLLADTKSQAVKEVQAERDRLRREIETVKDQALQELWKHTAELATLISEKTIRRKLTEDDHRKLVDEALGEIRAAGAEARHFTATGKV